MIVAGNEMESPPAIPGCRIERVVMQGGFGTVYNGRLMSLDIQVAIKVAHADIPGAAAQLAAEIEALEKLGPPVTPVVHGHGQLESGERYLIMEYIEWPTLEELESRHPGGMPLDTFLSMADALARALAHVHERGWYHGDLKPANVFISDAAQVKLIDFGSAARLGRATGKRPNQRATTTLGTPAYMSPEQCLGLAPLDARTDVYSLGVIWYEMLLGRPPFSGSREQVMHAHRDYRPPPPSLTRAMPPALEQLIMTCLLAKIPEQRFDYAGALCEALAAIRQMVHETGDSSAPEPRPLPRPALPAARNQRSMTHLFLDTAIDLGSLRDALRSYRAHIAHIDGTRICVLFDTSADKQPWSEPLRAAEDLLSQALCTTIVLDVGVVTLRKRRTGTVSYRSPLFAERSHYPRHSDRHGLLGTRGVVDLLPARAYEPQRARDQLFPIRSAVERSTHTTSGFAKNHRLVGRESVLSSLVEHARASLISRRASMATVIADAGHGKSHLCAGVLERLTHLYAPELAGAGGIRVLGLQVSDAWRDDAHVVPRLLLRQILQLRANADIEQRRQALMTRLADGYDPEALAVLGWILEVVPASAPEIQRLQAVPGGLHRCLVRALGQALRACASVRPLCLVLDGAHLTDPATLDALEYATLSDCHAPLWVCVFARPEFPDQRPDWGVRAAGVHEVELGPLDHACAAELCRVLLMPAENVPDAAIDLLVERTQGVPVLIVELIRALLCRGLVRKRESGDRWFVATDELDVLPAIPLVDWLVDKELQSLPDELANYARLLSLLPGDFSFAELAGILAQLDLLGLGQMFPVASTVFLRRLHAVGLLHTRPDGRLGFAQTFMRERIAASIEPALAERIHEAAYRYYGHDQVLDARTRLMRLAFHAQHAGAREHAGCTYLELADRAAHEHAYVQAERLYGRALALLSSVVIRHKERFLAIRGRGSMRYRTGRYDDSSSDFKTALEWADTVDLEARIHVLLDYATALDWSNEYRTSQTMVERARALAGEQPSPLIEARLLLGQGRSLVRFGPLAEARESLEAAIAIAETLGDPGYETLVIALFLLALILPVQDTVSDTDLAALGKTRSCRQKARFIAAGGVARRSKYAEILARPRALPATRLVSPARSELPRTLLVMDRLIALCEERDDRLHLATALVNRRVVCIAQKRVQQTLQDAARAIQLSRELGIPEFEYVCEYNMGEILFQMDDVHGARPHVERAIQLESRRPSGSDRPLARLLEARILAFEGRDDQLRPLYADLLAHQAHAQQERRTDAEFLPTEQLHLDMIALALNNADDSQWQALLERAERDAVEQEYLEVIEMYGLTLWRQGRLDEARRVLTEAVAYARDMPTIMDDRLAAHLREL